MKEIEIGMVVKSKQGRDKDRMYLVMELLNGNCVLVADGRQRKIEKLKKKKIKHLMIYNSVIEEVSKKITDKQKIDDSLIRKSLDPFLKKRNKKRGG